MPSLTRKRRVAHMPTATVYLPTGGTGAGLGGSGSGGGPGLGGVGLGGDGLSGMIQSRVMSSEVEKSLAAIFSIGRDKQ
jgi:hypothetical protein